MGSLLEQLEKYIEGCVEDDHHVIKSDAEHLVFKSVIEIKQLKEALNFYARKETYEYQHQYYGDGNVETREEPIVDDRGAIARQALEETK